MKQEYEKLSRLYQLYEQRMYRIAYAILRQAEQAEDAVQEVFLRLLFKMDKVQDVTSEQTQRYLLAMIKNEAIDQYRRNQMENERRAAQEQADEMAVEPLEEWLKREAERQQVQEVLGRLPEKFRDIVWLRVVKGKTSRETAKILGISEALVRKRLERARKSIAGKKEDGYGLAEEN